MNPGALDLLPAQPAPRQNQQRTPPRQTHPTPHRTPNTPAQTTPAPQATAPAATPAAPAPPAKPTLPVTPPAIAALPPPAPLPPTRPQPAPVVSVVADAPGAASPITNGVRVTFGPDRQDLNPTTAAALRELAARLRTNESATVNIYAYAAGTPEDPSTARRLSLGRALAARAVLINEGIASTRIYPRSLGAIAGETERDRVDVVIGTPGPPATPATPTTPTPPK